MAGEVRCVSCGGRCPLACRCPECRQRLCDDCYPSHFETGCTPALAAESERSAGDGG
jgi:hypothetical protein